jgi:hypothetical protein
MAAPRAYWKGYLKLSLVPCPIALYPASSQSEKTHFHLSIERPAIAFASKWSTKKRGAWLKERTKLAARNSNVAAMSRLSRKSLGGRSREHAHHRYRQVCA